MRNKFKIDKRDMDKHPMSYLFKDIDYREREKIKSIVVEEIFPGAILTSVEMEESESDKKVKPDIGPKSVLIKADGLEDIR